MAEQSSAIFWVLCPEQSLHCYSFNYQKAKPNRFAHRSEAKRLNIVVLDEDLASGLPHLAAKI